MILHRSFDDMWHIVHGSAASRFPSALSAPLIGASVFEDWRCHASRTPVARSAAADAHACRWRLAAAARRTPVVILFDAKGRRCSCSGGPVRAVMF